MRGLRTVNGKRRVLNGSERYGETYIERDREEKECVCDGIDSESEVECV